MNKERQNLIIEDYGTEFTFEKSIALLLKGKLKLFFKDLSELWRFLSSFSKNKSFLSVIRVVLISVYHLGKTLLSCLLRRFRSK